MLVLRGLILGILASSLVGSALAQDFVREPFRIPMERADPRGLEALLVRPAGAERLPLALITHGTPGARNKRFNMTPLAFIPIALEFARRGWAAAIVMRRGYGDSGEEYVEHNGPCHDRDYRRSARTSAEDLKAAIAHLAKRDDIDTTRIIAIGASAGGLAVTALAADPPPGLLAGFNFAGGRGVEKPEGVCQEDRLVYAFRMLGETARVPMLWVYSRNDSFFRPALARRFHEAFRAGGGIAEFIMAPDYRDDGHYLLSARGIPQWTPRVDAFLEKHGLALRRKPLPLPRPALAAPRQLKENGRKSFADFLISGPHKAFAVSTKGAFGWQSGKRTIAAAKHEALALCRKHADDCRVVIVDEAVVAGEAVAR